MLKAIGKCIDTLPISRLFSQGEHLADTVIIEVDRFHDGEDLSGWTFLMRGVTTSGGETETILEKTAEEQTIRLTWKVDKSFTTEAGTLELDLIAYRSVAETPAQILRYQLPPVQVIGQPGNEETLDTKSYTEFLIEVRETAENAIAEITEVVNGYKSELSGLYEDRIAALESAVQQLQTAVAAMTPISILTQEAYDALPEPDPETLYVITASD